MYDYVFPSIIRFPLSEIKVLFENTVVNNSSDLQETLKCPRFVADVIFFYLSFCRLDGVGVVSVVQGGGGE